MIFNRKVYRAIAGALAEPELNDDEPGVARRAAPGSGRG
jgi:hypothetical protein